MDFAAAGRALGDAATATAASNALRQLREDRAAEALRGAFCNVVTSVANDPNQTLPTTGEWTDYMVSEAQRQVFGVSANVLQEKAQEFTAAAQLAQVNPYAAARYVEGCHILGLP